MQTWIIPAALGAVTSYLTLQPNQKLVKGLPKIGKKTGIAISGVLFLIAYMTWKRGEGVASMLIDTSPPKIDQPMVAAGYSSTALVGREPVGYLTGTGRDDSTAEVPSSSLSQFPY